MASHRIAAPAAETAALAPFLLPTASHEQILSTDCLTGKVSNPDECDLVLYHGGGCPDGFGAAFAAWCKLGDRAEYIPVVHGCAPPDVRGRHVRVLDFCFNEATTQRLLGEAASYVILDHHASASEDLAAVGEAHKVFELQQSGATLSWNYFHAGQPCPLLLRYVEDKDIWRWALRGSAAVTAALATVPQAFADWQAITEAGEEGIQGLLRKGAALLEYRESVVQDHVRRAAPARLAVAPQFQGLIVNATVLGSEIGNALATLPGVDLAIISTYEHAAGLWRMSLRSARDDVDVAAIARQLGGGGHRRASGFQHLGAAIAEVLMPEAPVLAERREAMAVLVEGLPRWTRGKAE